VVTLTQLRTFLAVAETGSVRAAAGRLVVTESAVSSCLAALQRDLKLALVAKNGRGLRLTGAGEVYAGYVRGVLGLLDEARAAAAGEAGGGVLRMAAATTAGEQLLPALLASFRRRYPRVGLHLEVGNRERALRLAGDHQVDLVLGGRPPQGPGWPKMIAHAVRPNPLVVVCPPGLRAELLEQLAVAGPADLDHPATRPRLAAWLARQTWLLREPGSGTRATTEAFLEELQITPGTLTVGSNVAVCESVTAGLGVTLISRDAVARELSLGVLVELPAPAAPVRRDWCLVSREGRLAAPSRLFVDHVRQAPGWAAVSPPDSKVGPVFTLTLNFPGEARRVSRP
jgi:LysR family transcriptional regulator, low CO2-responsive transcriptional regulator